MVVLERGSTNTGYMMKTSLKTLTTKKKKPVKRRATSFEQIKLGDEPQILVADKMSLTKVFNWYNVFAGRDQRAGWLVEYMKDHDYSEHDVHIVQSKGRKLLPTICYLARLIARGVTLEDKHVAELDKGIGEFVTRHTSNEVELDDEGNPIFTATPKKAIKAASKLDITALVDIIESQFDSLLNGESYQDSVYEALRTSGCTGAHAKLLYDYFTPVIEEFVVLWEGNDEDLNEGYDFLTKKQRLEARVWLEQLFRDFASFMAMKRATRKAPKKKVKSAETLIKRLRFAKDSKEYKTTSIAPEKIIGAKALWVFNTKYRKLSVYIADSDAGLGVKGTSVTGWSKIDSKTKRLRRPELILPDILNSARAANLQTLKKLKSKELSPNGRINRDVLLLRTF